jgi:ABC-type transporter Mla maintaining outer membrane lipid asymmetry ATPase subunit MlaF
VTAGLVAQGLSVRRGAFGVEAVNLALSAGESLLVFGPSLAGKTTLLKALAGLLPSTGEIAIDGQPLWAGGSVVAAVQQKIGVVFQSEALFDSLSAADNVALPLLRRGSSPAAAAQRAAECLAEVGLSDAGHKLPEQLSGGMRKRVALARALAPRCPVLLIDDPVAGLDPGTTARIANLLRRVRDDGHALVLFAADPGPLWSLATSALALEGGRIVARGSPDSVRDRAHDLLAAS